MKKSLEICRREDRTRFWNKLFKLLNSALEFAENTALFFPPSRYPFFFGLGSEESIHCVSGVGALLLCWQSTYVNRQN